MSKSARIKFKISSFKLRFTYMKRIRLYLKALRLCVKYLNKITIPTNDTEYKMMSSLLEYYDNTIVELNDYVEVYRKRVDEYYPEGFWDKFEEE